ncbi:Creatinase/Prolidase N-terminal domain-containing protein [Pholiota molesta]|nr:Creatinase/Prolidase N-terminal domain-containing protein [Pholiota molesta]
MWRTVQVWFWIQISRPRSAPSLLRPHARPLSSTAAMGAAGQQTVHTTERLARLRELMKSKDVGVQAVVVPSEDEHSSEYLAHCDERRAFISGFNGSAGCAVITLDNAYLFTDGRYFLQAGKQLDQNWKLMKQGLPDVPTWQEFLHKDLNANTKIGIDAKLISASDAESLTKQLAPKSSELVSLPYNPVDAIWEDRPTRPANEVFYLDEKYSGQSHSDKVAKVREELQKKNAKAIVVTMLDEIAWLFNLRGSDIDFNPVFFAYAVVTTDKVILFVNDKQLDASAKNYLGTSVEIQPYDAFFAYLKSLPSSLDLKDDAKILIGDKASLAVAEALGEGTYTIVRSPVTDLKAVKNATELDGFRKSHVRDGAALARYFAWLEERLEAGAEVSESAGADVLEKYRA